MTRAVTMLAMFLTFLAFANTASAGGMERVQGPMVNDSGAIVLLQSRHDRCQTAATCSLSCVVCAAGMHTKTTDLSCSAASGIDLHRALKGRTASERLYRPPKVNRHLTDTDEQLQIKGTQDA